MSHTVNTYIVTEEAHNTRLDQFLLSKKNELSRNFIKKLIKDKQIKVNDKIIIKTSFRIKTEDQIEINIPQPQELNIKPQKIPLEIIYEDKNLLIINKQAGIVVHPTNTGHHQTSIVNAIMYHCQDSLSGIGGVLRPGIVHRLDKDTSGLLLIAKNNLTHRYLSNIIKDRQIKKHYLVLVQGLLKPQKGRIEAPIGRSLKDRKKMTVSSNHKARAAVTEYTVQKYFKSHTLIQVNLITGRTHQIRVHFKSIGFPVVGDPIYGDKKTNQIFQKKFNLTRQFLHAQKLTLKIQKDSKEEETFTAPLPSEFIKILSNLV